MNQPFLWMKRVDSPCVFVAFKPKTWDKAVANFKLHVQVMMSFLICNNYFFAWVWVWCYVVCFSLFIFLYYLNPLFTVTIEISTTGFLVAFANKIKLWDLRKLESCYQSVIWNTCKLYVYMYLSLHETARLSWGSVLNWFTIGVLMSYDYNSYFRINVLNLQTSRYKLYVATTVQVPPFQLPLDLTQM